MLTSISTLLWKNLTTGEIPKHPNATGYNNYIIPSLLQDAPEIRLASECTIM
jgi:hypothetical protein